MLQDSAHQLSLVGVETGSHIEYRLYKHKTSKRERRCTGDSALWFPLWLNQKYSRLAERNQPNAMAFWKSGAPCQVKKFPWVIPVNSNCSL